MKKSTYPLSKLVIIEGQHLSTRGINTYKDLLKSINEANFEYELVQLSDSVELLKTSMNNSKMSMLQFGAIQELVKITYFSND